MENIWRVWSTESPQLCTHGLRELKRQAKVLQWSVPGPLCMHYGCELDAMCLWLFPAIWTFFFLLGDLAQTWSEGISLVLLYFVWSWLLSLGGLLFSEGIWKGINQVRGALGGVRKRGKRRICGWGTLYGRRLNFQF